MDACGIVPDILSIGACDRNSAARTGRAVYRRRKALIEPVFGVLKEQRGMRRFRRRGLAKVAVEMLLAATAYNLTRLYHARPSFVTPPG